MTYQEVGDSEKEIKMVQVIGYFDDEVDFSSGPFVVVRLPFQERYRIECEFGDKPILCHGSIYPILEELGYQTGQMIDLDSVSKICDILNQMVKDEKILKIDGFWVG